MQIGAKEITYKAKRTSQLTRLRRKLPAETRKRQQSLLWSRQALAPSSLTNRY